MLSHNDLPDRSMSPRLPDIQPGSSVSASVRHYQRVQRWSLLEQASISWHRPAVLSLSTRPHDMLQKCLELTVIHLDSP